MRRVNIENYKKIKSNNALFFSSQGISLSESDDSPFIPFELGIQYFDIGSVIKEGDIVVVQGTPFLNNPFRIVNPRLCLNSISNTYIDSFLRYVHLVEWDSKIKYCSVCGSKLLILSEITKKECSKCCKSFFPNLSPAVIVLIHRKNQILLARSPHFTPGLYSALAGFIDMGETAEAAVIREVNEEVGLKIKDLKYFGTQSWPFPSSFMIAFTAEYESGEILINCQELEDAKWFYYNELPLLPVISSISRTLIDNYVKNLNPKHP